MQLIVKRLPHTQSAFGRQRSETAATLALFRSVYGKRLGGRKIQLNFAKWRRAVGLPGAAVHSLRHTFATPLYHKSGDPYRIQRVLEHRQVTTTIVYAHIANESLRRAVAAAGT